MTTYEPYRDGPQPPINTERYFRTSQLAPGQPLVEAPLTLSELTGPRIRLDEITDLTGSGKAIGQLIVLEGRVLDEDARPLPGTAVEIWQANAAGKYRHPVDGRDAPLDPNFVGCGHCMTDEEGRYRFLTIRPGAYPVPNTGNWWRPPHVHFSLHGTSFMSRLVTQMYFPGDPLNEKDGILNAIPDADARRRLMAQPEDAVGIDEHALGYRFDIVLRGACPNANGLLMPSPASASQTLGPFFNRALPLVDDLTRGGLAEGEPIRLAGRVSDVNGEPVRDALIEIWQANAAGRYDHPLDRDGARPLDPNFSGFGRTLTGEDGGYEFRTIRPGAVPLSGNLFQAPHILVAVFAAGLMRRMTTRVYFPGEALNDSDPSLLAVPERRRRLLVGDLDGDRLAFDIRLRGEDETPFFGN